MSTIVSIDRAKLHLRVDGNDEDSLITGQLMAAELLSVSWLRRRVFADQDALNAAVSEVPAALAAATAAHEVALASAAAIENAVERSAAIAAADDAYQTAQAEAKLIRCGMVVNDLFTSAVLLTLGALYADRDELAEPPRAAKFLLQPMRAY